MKGIIYYESSFEKANEELKKMVDRYNQMRIPVSKCHYKRIGSYAKFENGDTLSMMYLTKLKAGIHCLCAERPDFDK